MSLTRALFNEFRPVFQMLDDQFFADPFSVVPQRHTAQTNEPNSQVSPWSKVTRTPHVHLTDEADKYVVEAELPGVPKENLDVSIGDNGRSLTIKGNTFSSSETTTEEKGKEKEVATDSQTNEQPTPSEGSATETPTTRQEPESQARWSTRSSFSRTVWLPKPVDAQKVTARLDNGILTLEIPKLQAQAHRITVA